MQMGSQMSADFLLIILLKFMKNSLFICFFQKCEYLHIILLTFLEEFNSPNQFLQHNI